MVDVPTSDLIERDAYDQIPVLVSPRRESHGREFGELTGLGDMRCKTHYEHAPALVVEVVGLVDLEGHPYIER